jgi:hypothetical protein
MGFVYGGGGDAVGVGKGGVFDFKCRGCLPGEDFPLPVQHFLRAAHWLWQYRAIGWASAAGRDGLLTIPSGG